MASAKQHILNGFLLDVKAEGASSLFYWWGKKWEKLHHPISDVKPLVPQAPLGQGGVEPAAARALPQNTAAEDENSLSCLQKELGCRFKASCAARRHSLLGKPGCPLSG